MKATMLTFLIVFFVYNLTRCQTFNLEQEASLEMKYWAYRYRFDGDDFDKKKYPGFIAKGEGPGMSLPIYQRALFTTTEWGHYNPIYDEVPNCYNQNVYGQNDVDGTALKGEIKFEDNPLIELGLYMSVLATEWKLLDQSNIYGSRQEELNNTELEIYYTLQAIIRLDLFGETIYDNLPPEYEQKPSVIDGFLARCDVPDGFAKDHFAPNYDLTGAITVCTGGYNNSLGDECEVDPQPLKSMQRNAMDLDEIIGLLMGLRLIHACLPDGVSYNGVDFKETALAITLLIIFNIQGDNWYVVDPFGNHVCRGAPVWEFSFPLCKMYKHMTGDDIQDLISSTVGLLSWSAIEQSFTGDGFEICIGDLGVLTLVSSLLNIDPSQPLCYNFLEDSNTPKILQMAAISSTWSASNLDEDAYRASFERPHYSLLSCFLDDREPNNPPVEVYQGTAYDFWINYLDTFTSSSHKDNTDCFFLPDETSNEGYERNGLNYMLAFNLFRLVFVSNSTYWLGNIINRNDYNGYPVTVTLSDNSIIQLGSNAIPLVHRSLDTYFLDCTIHDDANVSFTAQNEITKGLNFDLVATNNFFFDQQLATFDCTPNYYEPSVGGAFVSGKSASPNFYPNHTISQGSVNNNSNSNAILKLLVYPNPGSNEVTVSINGIAIIQRSYSLKRDSTSYANSVYENISDYNFRYVTLEIPFNLRVEIKRFYFSTAVSIPLLTSENETISYDVLPSVSNSSIYGFGELWRKLLGLNLSFTSGYKPQSNLKVHPYFTIEYSFLREFLFIMV